MKRCLLLGLLVLFPAMVFCQFEKPTIKGIRLNKKDVAFLAELAYDDEIFGDFKGILLTWGPLLELHSVFGTLQAPRDSSAIAAIIKTIEPHIYVEITGTVWADLGKIHSSLEKIRARQIMKKIQIYLYQKNYRPLGYEDNPNVKMHPKARQFFIILVKFYSSVS